MLPVGPEVSCWLTGGLGQPGNLAIEDTCAGDLGLLYKLLLMHFVCPLSLQIDALSPGWCGSFGLSLVDLLLCSTPVVPKLFGPKAHQRTSKNLKAHLLCKIAFISRVITHIM